MDKERRQYSRVAVKFDVMIIIDGVEVQVKTWNLSMRGMDCTMDSRFHAGRPCTVVFILGPDVRFHVQGAVVRVGDLDAGIYFQSMEESSFFHLKRLVQYNAEDPDMIDTELAMQHQAP